MSPAFIPLEPEIGQEAEVDWGSAQAIMDGRQETIKFFCLRSKYSGKNFVRAYPGERQQAFFDGHIQAFRFFEGVFPRVLYDNLTTAVLKVLRGKDRREQEAFARFPAYYNFQPCCRNYLVPVPQMASLEELNQRLLSQCLAYGRHRLHGREQTVQELFEMENSRLLSMPAVPFSNLQITTGKVDGYATPRVDGNRYSTPTLYVGRQVTVHLQVDRIEIFQGGKRLASHPRLFGKNKWQLAPDHYLELLQQRPFAFQAARPIRQWRSQWPPVLAELLRRFQESQGETKGIKAFMEVLKLYRDHPGSEVEAAIALALERQIKSSAGIKHLLGYYREQVDFPVLPDWPVTELADVACYGRLGGVS